MSTAQTLLLGGIAGVTIFLGLPLGRMQNIRPETKAFLAATATGILIFLLWDVLSEAVEPIEEALTAGRDGRFLWLSFLLLAGFFVGLMSLVYYDLWMKKRRRRAFLGPGAASTAEFEHEHHFTGMSPARWLAVFIATGIGLHNFSEGLAIGQSAAADQVSLAIVLIIGFGLHNATEGLGICAPLTGDNERPSWGFLGLLGLIGGGPTFIGTVVGQAWVNESVMIVFFALAAGSILYVVMELLNVGRVLSSKTVVTWGIFLGLFHRRHDVLLALGDDDVGEHEAAAGRKLGGDPLEEVLLAGAVEVVDGEGGHDQVERAFGQRVFEPRLAQVCVRQYLAGAFEHLGAGVDRDEFRVRMTGENAPGCLTGPDTELQNGASFPVRSGRGLFLQLLIGRDLGEHVVEVRLRVPVPLRHASTLRWAS